MTAAPLPTCPFCGADGEALRVLPPTCTPTSPYNPADRAYPVLRCGGCGASVHGEDWDALGASAIAAWNRRSPRLAGGADVEAMARAIDALRPFAWVADRMLAGPQFVRGFPDTLPSDAGDCEILTIGDRDGGNQTLRRRDFLLAREALIALQGWT